MFDKDAFEIRERAMEDEFFHRVDEKLRKQIRESLERDKARQSLVMVTGLTDLALIDAMIDAGFQPTTLPALALVPAIVGHARRSLERGSPALYDFFVFPAKASAWFTRMSKENSSYMLDKLMR